MIKLFWILFIAAAVTVVSGLKGPFGQQFPKFSQFSPPKNETGDPLFLSPLIKAGNITLARSKAKVSGYLGEFAKSYSGYLSVNKETCNSNLFFWYFPAAFNPAKAPVVLWLQGGPGGSSLFGLFVENGPFGLTSSFKLKPRNTSWALTHNVIYIDNPVGTGFSFTRRDECYTQSQTDVASDLYSALLQFFQMFPELKQNEFFVTGESYAGKYVPAIAFKIHTENPKAPKDKFINLKGVAIGDGLCDPETMTNYGDFLYQTGLVDEEDREYFKKISQLQVQLIQSKQWVKAFQVFDDLLNGDLSHHPSYFANATGFNYYFNYLQSESPKDFEYYNSFIQTAESRRSIHVGNLTYNDGVAVETHLLADVMQSVKPWVEVLIENYRVLIYNGQLDVIIAWPLTENFITSMKWSGADKYPKTPRSKWRVDGELAGYSKKVGNLTTLLVRNAGHMVPYDQSKWAFDMINRFTSQKPF